MSERVNALKLRRESTASKLVRWATQQLNERVDVILVPPVLQIRPADDSGGSGNDPLRNSVMNENSNVTLHMVRTFMPWVRKIHVQVPADDPGYPKEEEGMVERYIRSVPRQVIYFTESLEGYLSSSPILADFVVVVPSGTVPAAFLHWWQFFSLDAEKEKWNSITGRSCIRRGFPSRGGSLQAPDGDADHLFRSGGWSGAASLSLDGVQSRLHAAFVLSEMWSSREGMLLWVHDLTGTRGRWKDELNRPSRAQPVARHNDLLRHVFHVVVTPAGGISVLPADVQDELLTFATQSAISREGLFIMEAAGGLDGEESAIQKYGATIVEAVKEYRPSIVGVVRSSGVGERPLERLLGSSLSVSVVSAAECGWRNRDEIRAWSAGDSDEAAAYRVLLSKC